MKRISLILIAAAVACAQSSVIDSGSANAKTFGFYWETRLDPGSPEMGLGFGRQSFSENPDGALSVYRIFVDRPKRTYFGYVAVVGTSADLPKDILLVSVGPLVLTPNVIGKFRLGIDDLPAWKQLPFPGLNAQRLRKGDVVSFTLMANPNTGQKITESITVQEPSRQMPSFDPQPTREFSYPPGDARELTIADIEFSLNFPRIYLNGSSDNGSNGIREASGRTIQVEVPKLGKYTLSLVPHPGFPRAGEVRGTSLRFKAGQETVEIHSATRIVPSDGPFFLYVRRDGNGAGNWSLGTAGEPGK